ncbi:MAG: helix-turn-helix domain-containing protein [Lachnospiraceae bacterium]|nr:helix-turn-helix domain-containing protein [Lachnospiraceae bacterium]
MEFFSDERSAIVTSDRVLYTPSGFARDSLLHLQEIGRLTARKPHVSARAALASYLFFMVTEGEGTLTYEGKSYELTKGTCVFIDCRVAYSHATSPKKLWTLEWCHFHGLALEQIYKKYVERGGRPVFRPENAEAFQNVWERLFELAKGSDYVRDMKINEGLSSLLTLLMQESWHPEEIGDLAVKKGSVLQIKAYLDANYAKKITLDDLSARFYVNKYYLTRVFKERYGQSINSYLLGVRITRAKQLLRFTDKSVEEIGLECGLGALHYFSRVFHEVEGMPPSKYREQWKKST